MTSSSQLGTRIVVGLVLIALAVAAVSLGGFAFGLLVAVAVLLMFTEWAQLFRLPRGWRFAGLTVLSIALAMAQVDQPLIAIAALATGSGVLGLGARPYLQGRSTWIAIGLLYTGLPGIALIWLRNHPDGLGLALITLAIVWATDIFAYFTGRAIGGPRIAPHISPNKTWAGLAGGMAGATLVAWLLVTFASSWLDLPVMVALLIVPMAPLLAIAAQCGDFYESWLKRRIGVKDSGTLLPGHGGVLDRLDGLVPVAVLMAIAVVVAGVAG
ncbi:MAG: phosphatidate cytidylyltransferase [Polymorphobacter sp.]